VNYFYNIGYGSCEESEYEQYSFGEELSKDELRRYVEMATVKALEETIKDRKGENNGMFFFSEDGISFQCLWNEIKRQLVVIGFAPIKYSATYSIFGWPSIVCGDDWETQRGEELKSLTGAIPESLRKRAINLGQSLLRERKDKPDGEKH